MAKTTAADQDRVRLWILEWGKRLNLDHYTVNIRFLKRANPSDEEETTFADSTSHYAGLEAEIRVWKPFWSLPEAQQERVCLHELVHILLPDSISEEQTCKITEIIWRLVKGDA